jgi:hypothetical protein
MASYSSEYPSPIDPRIPVKLPEPLRADTSDYSTEERT